MESFARMMFGWTQVPLVDCYYANVGYMFLENMDVWMIMAMAIDRHLAISCPMTYRGFPLKNYIIMMCTPGVVYGLVYTVSSTFWLTDEEVNPCVLANAFPEAVMEYWDDVSMGICVITLILHGATFYHLYFAYPRRKKMLAVISNAQVEKQKIIFKAVIVQVFFFFISSTASDLTILSMERLNTSEDAIQDVSTLSVIPVLCGYTCNFYTHAWFSIEDREAFSEIFTCGTASVKVEKLQSVASTRSLMVSQQSQVPSSPTINFPIAVE